MTTQRDAVGSGRLLVDWFLAGAARNPDGGALLLAGRTWTYTEVRETALRWAHTMVSSLPRPRRIGLLAAHSDESYLGLLATAMTGAAVVPLNPDWPPARNANVARQADLDALIMDSAGEAHVPMIVEAVPSLAVLAPHIAQPSGYTGKTWLGPRDIARAPTCALPTPSAMDTAYLLFTSGSTGHPKGVPISHANIDHFLTVNHARYNVGDHDRVAQAAEQTFDVAMFNMFLAWGSGALLCPASRRERLQPVEFVNTHGITVWSSVPGVVAFAMTQGMLPSSSMPGLEWSFFAGEQLRREHVEAWQEAAPNSVVENLYGPTELTVTCTAYRWDPVLSPAHCVNGVVPIGVPSPGLRTHVRREREPGQRGELCVTGPQMFRGYLNPVDNADRFVWHEGRRWYRTGDLVEIDPAAGMVCLGRLDDQVKVRGHRVELGEVEATFLDHHRTDEAIAVLPGPADDALIIFYTGDPVPESAARETLRRTLPEYMVPARIIRIPRLPRTGHGKIDRSALGELARTATFEDGADDVQA